MFIGREKELQLLERMASSKKYEGLILYGRRRVGKTALLQQFAQKHACVFYAAQEKNDMLNLRDFSKAVQAQLTGRFYGEFPDWETAFNYLGDAAAKERVILIIDEFPFIASENPSVKSILQHIIDHSWQEKNIFLILCGSSISFMENEVMGYKSPLYGRMTGQLELEPFDYLTSSEFFPKYSNVEKLLCYGILGGIPFYLQTFNDNLSISQNIAHAILAQGSVLHEEPLVLLRMEFREPSIYNSILEAIASGASRMNDIALRAKIDTSKCSRYLASLQEVKLVHKQIPCGEADTSKRGIYVINDNFYKFWYRYIFDAEVRLAFTDEESLAEEIAADLSVYMGPIFESICTQYMYRLAKTRKLPFQPWRIGKWWGNNPKLKKQDDMDILCLDKAQHQGIFCECKFREELLDLKEYQDLLAAAAIFTEIQQKYYYLFVKSGFSKAVQAQAELATIKLFTLDDLFPKQ